MSDETPDFLSAPPVNPSADFDATALAIAAWLSSKIYPRNPISPAEALRQAYEIRKYYEALKTKPGDWRPRIPDPMAPGDPLE
jgi:hypothetical protein